ncbi:phosphoglycerate mutase family protein [Streptomyces microflavus]|uniref:phosphoglycerate mutase family protein n=1 Tax=Streptomyces microflavus TaxID=1919 RepID=UPI00342902B1
MAVEIVYETHATTTDNEAGIATGWLPGRLSDLGCRQARELGERRPGDGFAAVFASDLHRAVQIARTAFLNGRPPIDAEAVGVGVGVGVGEDAGDIDALVVEAAHVGGDVGPGRGSDDRIPDEAFGDGRAQEVGPAVGALRLRAGDVLRDGPLDPGGHAAQVREERREVDAGVAEGRELAGHHRPVLTGHEVVEEGGRQVLAEFVGGPPGLCDLPEVLVEFLFLAVVVFLGGAADRVRDREDQPDRHRRCLRGFGQGFGERLTLELGGRGGGHGGGSPSYGQRERPGPGAGPGCGPAAGRGGTPVTGGSVEGPRAGAGVTRTVRGVARGGVRGVVRAGRRLSSACGFRPTAGGPPTVLEGALGRRANSATAGGRSSQKYPEP